ncbi:hypothetical protein ISG33_00710 [Glaciecola sp. MH2013]|uniref:hypothetical protein n=1 Tax=Glaciecola sp. MH2013 TaxID=2785524 RepID=UPI0018A0CA7C|nr:hypothetical protein [Glaciecola sp. MH2013]MBF7071918.1 hypothetical protein [Glaciecola sp. MH2013]
MKLFYIAIAFCLVACSEVPPPSPTCRVSNAFEGDYQGPSACLIRVQNSLLVLERASTGLYDLAIGDSLSNESAQCTAHRQMWENTGFNVEVDQLLSITPDGTHLFKCHLSGGFDAFDVKVEPPDWASSSVAEIHFVNPFDTRTDNWTHPDNLIMYRDGYVAIGFVESNK